MRKEGNMLQVVLRLPLRLWCRGGGEAWLPWGGSDLARWRRKGGRPPRHGKHVSSPRAHHWQALKEEKGKGGRGWPTRHRLQEEAALAPLGMRRPHGVMTRQSLEDGRWSLHYLVDIVYLILP
jgi:hypothetical protein